MGKKDFMMTMQRNRKGAREKRNVAKRRHITARAHDDSLWWKQGNIKMAVNYDHTSCWVHKDLTVTTKQIWAFLTVARASGRKDESTLSSTTDWFRAGILDGH